MIHEPIMTRPAHAFRPVAAVQGIYFLLTGIWPLVSVDSFKWVTGPKTDLWLVYCVGCLVALIGVTLIASVIARRITRETAILAVGSAVALASIDIIFVYRQVIGVIYLADAIAELALVVWWTMTYVGVPRRRQPVDPLLARAQSVSQSLNGHRSGS